MFTRLVEINTKYGKTREVADIIQQKVLPILNKQQGFIDEIMLLLNDRTKPHRRPQLLEERRGCRALSA